MLKWIELLKPVDGHQAGKFLEVEETVARAYTDAGLAKDGGDGPDVVLLQRSVESFRSELKGFVDKTAAAITEAATAVAARPIIRGVGGDGASEGFSFGGDIRGGESEADRTRSVGDYFQHVVRSIVTAQSGDIDAHRASHERLTKVYKVERAMTESSGTSLGYTTPVIYESMILKEAAEEQVFVRNARKVPLGARQVEWPVLNQYAAPAAGQASMFGGVAVYRKGEATQRTTSDVSTKKVVLMAQDLTCMFRLSRDLLQDSTATLDAMIPALGGEAIGWRTDWEAWQGTGTGQMLGVLNSAATILVTRNTASHIKYQDVFSMYTRLLPRCKANAAWYVHPFAMADIMQLQDPGNRFIYLPTFPGQQFGSIGAKVPGTLLGLPVIESEKMSPLGTAGDLALMAMDRYLYGERAGLEIGLSEHFYYDTDELAIRLKLRNDGKPQLVKPIYLADGSGSNQVTAFVVLN